MNLIKEKEENKKKIKIKEETIEKLNSLLNNQVNKIKELEKEILENENNKLETIKKDSNETLIKEINKLQEKYKTEKNYNEILTQANHDLITRCSK